MIVVTAAGKWGTSTGNPVVALPVVAALFGFVWWLNAMGAKWLDRKLAEVDSIGR